MTIANLTFRLSNRFDFPQLVELENLVWNTDTAPADLLAFR
ncbi:hypothetical protein [Fictibacillus sp. NRS-1165]